MALDLLDPGSYQPVRFAFTRLLAPTYLVAFLVAVGQFRPLVGADGLRPLSRFVEGVSVRERPSLLHRYPSDRR